MKAVSTILAAGVLLALLASGCARPTAPYDQARQILADSRRRMVDGDKALSRDKFAEAGKLYARAANDLDGAVGTLETAERDVEEQIRTIDEQSHVPGAGGAPPATDGTVTIGSRDVAVSRFYIDTLRGYREALALAVVLRSLALQREGEAAYRGAADDVIDGDDEYAARQFAAALESFDDAGHGFRKAMATFGEAAAFIDQKLIGGDRLANAAPANTWPLVHQARQLVSFRTIQADAYRMAAARRAAQTGRIVEAYRERTPGNIPNIEILPLEPLPSVTRRGAVPPSIPHATLGK